MAREELALLVALLASAISVLWLFQVQNRDAVLWAGMLTVQTLPYWAAMIMAAVNAWPKKTAP